MGNKGRGYSADQEFVQNTQYAALMWLAIALVIAVLLYLTYFFTKGKRKKEKSAPVRGNQDAQAPVAGGRRPRRMRVRREENEDIGDFNDSDDEGAPWGEDKSEGKVGAKKQRKLEMKAEKRAERQAELEEREEKKKRDVVLAAERKKEEGKKLMEEAALAEIEKQKKEEQEKKEYDEYLKLKEAFTVEESGEVGILSEEESQSLLQEFIDYVKKSKVILLEDLASHFNLKTQEAIERLENLQEMGRLTGVMDDRGKFIYVSEDELRNMAKFIRQRGRIAISELAESSNTLITLSEEKVQDNVLQNVEVSA